MINDSQLDRMNDTQWLFEIEALNIEEERKYEDMALVAQAAKKSVINMLGLNLLPTKDDDTGLLRMREDHEIVPLVMATCREDFAKDVVEKFQDMQSQELALNQVEEEQKSGEEQTAEEFDDFMNADLEFIDKNEVKRLGVINSPDYEYVHKKIVAEMKPEDKKKFKEFFGFDPGSDSEGFQKVVSEAGVDLSKFKPDEESVVIEPEPNDDPSLVVDPSVGKRKVQIIIEPDDSDE